MSGIIEASSALRKRKHLKRGINFTLMVVGQSGCGRSTLINTLCGQQVVNTSTTVMLPTDTATEIPVQLREETVELEDEESVKIQLNIIDTPGFADSLDNSQSFELISDFIRHQYDEILLEESRVRRNPRFKDGRVHACLYMITPSGHGLKELDIVFMRQLGVLVNVIPVISKADSLTLEELKVNKTLIMEDIDKYDLPVYNFPFDEHDISDEEYETNMYLRSLLPFSIIGSNDVFDNGDGIMIRGRKYPWGTLDVEDATVSDFVVLRNMLLISHLNDLKEYTHEILYERYRTDALSGDTQNNAITYTRPDGSDPNYASPQLPSVTRALGNTHIDNGSNLNSPNPQDTYLAREEQIKLEEERLKAFEDRVQQELQMKRQELLQRGKRTKRNRRQIRERSQIQSRGQ
ncbi:hypothetical protein TPHA_0O00140 [Tetrapisispora phaffii CBS 4417]|uniref:Septin-type G domain-containing protein n=1 Tax=Tetrapisispora phaffii (strain ATCC 24235 / CBS 4417 / NBRC 1672 / NRRL Y-8282 / UCD 70-5) TaxID=1071381 RepID=G8C1F8_TETPH|nr:hypothetical protein TPHA_0O00140 [Tetrapisispora phaffii CBS 4417]CCE65986.1 hypothetical protein TPHA_0O00140 [Tetrapisispora phaffii CBS 4417]